MKAKVWVMLLLLLMVTRGQHMVSEDDDPLDTLPGRLMKKGVSIQEIKTNGDDFLDFMSISFYFF